MKPKVECPDCGADARIIKSVLMPEMYVYKCPECRCNFITEEVKNHNMNVINKSKDPEVLYESPMVERYAIGAIVCAWGNASDIEPRFEIDGVQNIDGLLIFKLLTA